MKIIKKMTRNIVRTSYRGVRTVLQYIKNVPTAIVVVVNSLLLGNVGFSPPPPSQVVMADMSPDKFYPSKSIVVVIGLLSYCSRSIFSSF